MSENNPEPQSVEELPQWARREIESARREAQGLRERLKSAEESHEQAMTQLKQEQEAALAAAADDANTRVAESDKARAAAELTLSRTNLAVERGLPLSVVKLIAGDTDEEMIESADALAALRTNPTQSETADPAQAAEPVEDPRVAAANAFFGASA